MPVSSLKPRWHDLLAIVKQFITCEGRFGLVFLYHLRLLMSFIDFPLNMPYFLLRSLYKMGKWFKRQRSDSSLFHHGLIKIILVHQLQLQNDCWDAFVLRNGFGNSELGQVDKPVIIETLVKPTASPPPLLPCDLAPNIEPSTYPDVTQPDNQPGSHPKSCTKTVKKPTGKKLKGSVDVNYKNKRAGRLISRCARNKFKPCADTNNTIELSEDSDSEIERFLAEEDPMSYGLYPDTPYDYVNNLPPCLKGNPEFSGIRLCDKPTFRVDASPILNAVSANAQSLQPQCDECRSWIDRYYTDVPLLQSRLKSLKDQVDLLTNENSRLQSITQAKEKCLKTTGSVIFKNVEATTTIVNSKIA
jgi:hypothetical protein